MTAVARPSVIPKTRWVQLVLGVLSMILIANMQYAWTLFVGPMRQAHGWDRAGIQWAFSIFIATETWITPFAGYAVDRLGPRAGVRLMVLLGGLLAGCGWVINGFATSLPMLYVGAAVSGLGAGGVYAACVGNAVRWFPDRRGLAVGVTAAGFGAGAALTVLPIQSVIAHYGYNAAFLWFGVGQGTILLIVSVALRGPDLVLVASAAIQQRLRQSQRSYSSLEMLGSPVFWLMYVMFVFDAATGLMATAQLAPIAKDFGFADQQIFGTASVLSVALITDNIMNGLARPFFGGISDRVGREGTMALAFTLSFFAYAMLTFLGHSPWMFIISAGLIFFTWGEIFSLFPSLCTDTFGPKNAAANASLLYTAKGTAALLVPLANLLQGAAGRWEAVFAVAGNTSLLIAALAIMVLKPLRLWQLRRDAGAVDQEQLAPPLPAGHVPG